MEPDNIFQELPMSPDTKDFYGQDVPSAIKDACEALGVAQELLTIEVVETGSKGIFGLIRKKAHIRVTIQTSPSESAPSSPPAPPNHEEQVVREPAPRQQTAAANTLDIKAPSDAGRTGYRDTDEPNGDDDDDDPNRELIELSEESLSVIKTELQRLLELMDCPSVVTVEDHDGTALCTISDDYASVLTSQEGRTLDSLQYLLRKIVSRKLPGRIQLSIDVGDYRARRHEHLRELALQFAAQVKEDGKTQVIASLNPSERRVVHVCLQDDPEIRSRSIGEGLFKKVLIYKPGKPRKSSGRKRPRGGSRKKNGPRQDQ
jgi:spoIIIJ-associated protein